MWAAAERLDEAVRRRAGLGEDSAGAQALAGPMCLDQLLDDRALNGATEVKNIAVDRQRHAVWGQIEHRHRYGVGRLSEVKTLDEGGIKAKAGSVGCQALGHWHQAMRAREFERLDDPAAGGEHHPAAAAGPPGERGGELSADVWRAQAAREQQRYQPLARDAEVAEVPGVIGNQFDRSASVDQIKLSGEPRQPPGDVEPIERDLLGIRDYPAVGSIKEAVALVRIQPLKVDRRRPGLVDNLDRLADRGALQAAAAAKLEADIGVKVGKHAAGDGRLALFQQSQQKLACVPGQRGLRPQASYAA